MNFIALKMLVGDRAKYIGIIIGLTFASFLVTWPSAIFSGVMSRTFSFVTDVSLPDLWIVDLLNREAFASPNLPILDFFLRLR